MGVDVSSPTPRSDRKKTVEFRIKPHRSNDNYVLFALSGSGDESFDYSLILQPYTGSDKLVSGDAKQYGKLSYRSVN